jgi:ABC-type uncharacterized transport system substrate-binding protein
MAWQSVRVGVAAALTIATSLALAQEHSKLPRVAYLWPGSPGLVQDEYVEGLRALGYVEGKSIVVEWRFAEGHPDRLAALASQLVSLKPDVIVPLSSSAVQAIRKATRTIPTVAVDLETDPIAAGLVANLARPGGNVTGFFLDFQDLNGKRLELLKETLPGISRVAMLWDSSMDRTQLKAAQTAARALHLNLQVLEVQRPRDVEGALRAAVKAGASALLMPTSPMLDDQLPHIVSRAIKYRLPTLGTLSFHADAGVLMTYGPDLKDLRRRSATYVDKILKGAKPADLPIQRPMKFEFVINRRTARTLGANIPTAVVVRADRVIE